MRPIRGCLPIILLAATASMVACCQPEPVEVSTPIRLGVEACAGHRARLLSQPGSPTLTIMIARPDGTVPALVFEKVGTSYALQASPGLTLTGAIGAAPCGVGGMRIIGNPSGDVCVEELARAGECISP